MSAILLKFWPYIVIAALVAALAGMGHLYLGKRDELAAQVMKYNYFVGATEVIGKQAEETKKEDEAKHEQNLQQVKENHEQQIDQVRTDAVANYIAAHPVRVRNVTSASSGSGSVRGDGSGLKLDDGTSKECILDQSFIQDAAEDAEKVGAWIEYCQLNKCPIRPDSSTQ